jgi:CheY-like chemotaxis protein
MLVKESFEVETVESAEAALSLLEESKPDVIFMDHMMPGMDGFAAVKRLKSNPETESIVIVMYTSKEGEVYRGQAQALGAADILNKPASQTELQRVLARLHAQAQVVQVEARTEEFVERRTNPRGERRVNPDRRAEGRRLREEEMQPALPTWWTRAAVAIVAIAGLATLLHLVNASAERREAVALQQDLLQSVLWLANKAGDYAYSERPFEGRRLEVLEEVVNAAEMTGFRGVIELTSHVGQFCLRSEGGRYIVPGDSLPISACSKIGDTEKEVQEHGLARSGAFRQFVAQVNTDRRSDLRIELITAGAEQPLLAYPPEDEVRHAGDWNRIAAVNNRVEITLRPESSD